jgi:hypothetical protein
MKWTSRRLKCRESCKIYYYKQIYLLMWKRKLLHFVGALSNVQMFLHFIGAPCFLYLLIHDTIGWQIFWERPTTQDSWISNLSSIVYTILWPTCLGVKGFVVDSLGQTDSHCMCIQCPSLFYFEEKLVSYVCYCSIGLQFSQMNYCIMNVFLKASFSYISRFLPPNVRSSHRTVWCYYTFQLQVAAPGLFWLN